ncbi:MAG: oligosaccharide flippase family protein [Acidobacteria bacterium]|nr:oligosaccharide flippase family protein [Acidobacteriota bacterium]
MHDETLLTTTPAAAATAGAHAPRAPLTGRVRAGVAWGAGGFAFGHAVNLARSVVLARLLAPADFGLFQMSLTLLVAAQMLTQAGLELSFLVNKFADAEEERRHLDTVWTAELVRRLVLCALLAATASAAARFYGEPSLRAVLLVLALAPLAQGLQNPGLLIERKGVRFRRIVWLEQSANLCASAAAVLLALRWPSAWALVWGQLISAAAGAALSYLFHAYRPRLALDRRALRRAFDSGKYVVLIVAATYVTTTVDNVAVGRLLGAGALGLYALAYNLASLPVALVVGAFGAVLLPAYAELGAEGLSEGRAELPFARAFRLGACAVLAAALPLFVLSDEIVALLYGGRWAGAGALLRVLALVGFWRATLPLTAPLLVGMNRVGWEARAKLAEAALFLLLLYPLVARFGAAGAAWAGVAQFARPLARILCAAPASLAVAALVLLALQPALRGELKTTGAGRGTMKSEQNSEARRQKPE